MENKRKLGELFLLGISILLVVLPLVMLQDSEFVGADAEAVELIGEMSPDYQPWFSGIWAPARGEVESLLFALQAAFGAGVICYGIGYFRGKTVIKEG